MLDKFKQKLVCFLTKLLTKLNESEVKRESLYEDLTPSNDVDKDGKYSEAISWGLRNKKVKNIALTGPYGSGKSSLLNTFQEQHGTEYHFLNISLATFHADETEVENKLEKSILQQMIYRVQDRIIPFSRFKRIKHVRTRSVILHILFFIAFIVAGIYLLKPDTLQGIYDKTSIAKTFGNGTWQQILPTLILGLFFIGYPLLVIKSIYRFTRANLNFNKVTIANATVEKKVGEESQSIFDKYLDEILYFFEATKYDVVIFEDLDRFDNIDIFENLRELNDLINNSEQVGRRVVFIYAIKDDIFGEENSGQLSRNRTKFFDFIIPVIPIINASNSGDVLAKKIKRSPYSDKIYNHFLDDVTIYIDDMRILKNIFNEFVVYQEKLGEVDLDSNKLLAMVIYKNIYPVDFSRLQYKKGLVYEFFQKKQLIIEEQVKLIDPKIQELETKLKNIEVEALTSIEELQHVYLSDLGISRLQANNYYIQIDNNRYQYNTVTNSSFFEKLKNANSIRYYLPHRNNVGTVKDIATVFGAKRNYFEREAAIKLIEENGIEDVKQELAQLKMGKQELSSQSLQEIIAKSDPKLVFSDAIYEKKLLIYLLRNGYVDEMYNHYITYFYPENLSLSDIQFVFSIKNHEALPFDYKLENVEKIMTKLVGSEFKQAEVLNYHLLNYIMEHPGYQSYYDSIIEQLANGSATSVKFIHIFKEKATKKAIFIRSICKNWNDFWNFVSLKSSYTDQEKDDYLEGIFAYAEIETIIQMDKNSVLSFAISKHPNILKVNANEDKLKEILLKLNVKFDELEHLREAELFNFVVQHNLYEINKDTLSVILKDELNITYASIKRFGQQPVIDYVDENIDTFVKVILLDEETHAEPEESLLELLNREGLDKEIKEAIVMNKSVAITDISDLVNELWSIVIRENRIVASWPNVIAYFNDNDKTITNLLVDFLNYPANRRELAKNQLDELDDIDRDILELISDEIIKCENITDESFEVLSLSILRWNSYPMEGLSEKRVRTMVENNVFCSTPANFKSLKTNFDPLHILLVEQNIEPFISEQANYLLDASDVKQLLDSDKIPNNYKKSFVEQLDPDSLTNEHIEILTDLINFISKHNLEIKGDLLIFLLETTVTQLKRVALLTGQIDYLEIGSITEHLTRLDKPYSEIAEKGRRLQFKNNKTDKALVAALENKNYISSSKKDGKKLRVNTRIKMDNVN
ncbi:YobI family P-loop NTPase [Virgibacillus salinus]|uniref:YobI-like P-loop NTPase domain-containing protein n=1 Tax=Virgibacillus salinus TaxID=553311 RepID=A0A1H1GHR7_9BACI|nr:hypothetical protein [Virgibacillus salinus]SDR12593.1 hypothetical protein SAMN05216231_3726 [Virgibacillus salinus]